MDNQLQDPELFQYFIEISIISQLTSAKLGSVLPDGLKLSQFAVLNHLFRMGHNESPAQLARALQVTKGAITNTLQRLLKRGLVNVVSDPDDGRSKLVSLTKPGRKMRELCIHTIKPFLLQLEKQLGKQSFKNALPHLEEVRKYLDDERS